MLKKLRKIYLNVGIISATTIGMILPAYAAPVADAGEGAARVGEMSNAMLNGLLALVGFIGVVMFIVNGYKLFFGGEQGQETKGKQFKGLIGGAFLSTPLIFLAMFTTTFSGDSVDEARLKSTISTYSPTTN
ncbi:MAG: hypothetical protein ACJAXJ_001187 [Colwellia sp.]|jgi:hypothetical protein